MESSKKPWQSKTIVLNFLMAAGTLLYPPLAQWVSEHPVELAALWSVASIVLRLVSKDKVSLSE